MSLSELLWDLHVDLSYSCTVIYLFVSLCHRSYQSIIFVPEMSISQLKQLAVSKSQQIPTLNTLLPFLEVSANQEYLVARVNGENWCVCPPLYSFCLSSSVLSQIYLVI